MCYRLVTDIPAQRLAALFKLREVPQLKARYNVAPNQLVTVVRSDGDHNRVDLLKWGFVPSWSKDESAGSQFITVGCEKVEEKEVFHNAIKYRRCIIPVTGFYEWRRSGGTRQAFYIHLADRSLMCLAGLWEQWKAPDNTLLESFAVLTVPANKLVQPLHDRMPVILHPEDYSLWLNKNMHDTKQLQPLCIPFPAEAMSAYQVPDLVDNLKFDGPACIARV